MLVKLALLVAFAQAKDLDYNLGPFHFHMHTETSGDDGAESPHKYTHLPGHAPVPVPVAQSEDIPIGSIFNSRINRFKRGLPFATTRFPRPIVIPFDGESPVAHLRARINTPMNIDHMFGNIVNSLFEEDEPFAHLFREFSPQQGFHPAVVTRVETRQLPGGGVMRIVSRSSSPNTMNGMDSMPLLPFFPPFSSASPASSGEGDFPMDNTDAVPLVPLVPLAPFAPFAPLAPDKTNEPKDFMHVFGGLLSKLKSSVQELEKNAEFPVEQVSVCAQDAVKLCSDAVQNKANYLSIFLCLRHNHDKITAECAKDVEQSPVFHCVEDVNKFCQNAHSKNCVKKCLDHNKAKLSKNCVATIVNKASPKVTAIQGQPEVTVGGKIIKVTQSKTNVSAEELRRGKHIDPRVLYGGIGGGVACLLLVVVLCCLKCRKGKVGGPAVKLGEKPEAPTYTKKFPTPKSNDKEYTELGGDLEPMPLDELEAGTVLETIQLDAQDAIAIIAPASSE